MRETVVKTEEFKDSPLGKIPKDWDVCPLKDLTDSPDSITYGVLKPGEYIPDGIPLLQIQDVIHGKIEPSKLHRISKGLDGQYARTRLYGGEIVMSLVGTIGKIAQIPDLMAGANLHRNLARIPVSRGNSSRFVFHYLQSQTVQEAIAATTFGSTQSLLNLTDLRELLVAVPPPQEQQTIAHIIDTIDSTIAHTSSLIAKLKQMKAGLLYDLLTRGLDENGELRDAIGHPEQFKDSPLGQIPKDWEVLPLQNFTLSSAFGPRFSGNAYAPDGNVATLRTTDMDDEGNLNLSTMPLARLNLDLYRSHFLEISDLLVSRSGTCGITAVFPGFDIPVIPGAFVIRFRFKNGLLSEFIRRYFNWETGRERVLREAEGGVQKNLRGSTLLKLLIPVPIEAEQREILRRLDAHESRIRTEEAYRDKLKLQKQGLMHDLLTGMIRVKDT
jgi:type I restriction enzyme S subunit